MVIKELNIANPFADFGSIVKGNSRFIGRHNEINEIRTRVLYDSFGNLAIVGLPRIGKSSLVWNALISLREEVFKDKHILIYINVGEESNAIDFFKRLAFYIIDAIEFEEDYSVIYKRLFNIYIKLKENQTDRYEFQNYLKKFFVHCKRLNLRITFILDEFDRAEQLFSVADFQLLRAIGSEPDRKVCLVTVSRRTLQELEPDEGAISNFYGVFSELRLQLLSENDLKAYWQRVENLGLEVSEEYKKEVFYFVGSHPYWLDMVNYHIFNGVKAKKKSSIELLFEIGSELRKTLWDNYNSIINLLKSELIFEELVKVMIGPTIELSQQNVEKLLKYDVLKRTDLGYSSLSKHFIDYLKYAKLDVPLWPLWNKAENHLRNLIKHYLVSNYGQSWQNNESCNFDNKDKIVSQMEKFKHDTLRAFGSERSSNDIIDYSVPWHMKNIISCDWNWFSIYLKGELNSWEEIFNNIEKYRKPLAHSNTLITKEEEINFIRNCETILKINLNN
jgi:hypothetical protein